MPVTNASIFSATSNQAAGNQANQEELPKAEFWMNFGVPTSDDRYTFLALPKKGFNGRRDSSNGCPLSLEDLIEEAGSNDNRSFIAGQNELLQAVIAAATSMAPGETQEFPIPTFPIAGFCLQIRRVNQDTGQTADSSANRFSLGNLTKGQVAPAQQEEAPAASDDAGITNVM